MELPDISVWNAGSVHDETTFNAVSYALDFLLNPPECRVDQTSHQSVPTGAATATLIEFQSASVDNDGMWSASTPDYITIQTSGWYELEYAVSWETKQSGDSTNRIIALFLNEEIDISQSYGYAEFVNDASVTPQIWQSYDMFLTEGTKLSLGVFHEFGSTISTWSSGSDKELQTFLRARWASL